MKSLAPSSWWWWWPLLRDDIAQTARGISRAKCSYCIGLSSCVLVVVVSCVIQTLLARAPLIFLRQAEAGAGQIDITLAAGSYSDNSFMNYSTLAATLAGGATPSAYAFHSPRHVFPLDWAWPAGACVAGSGPTGGGASAPPGWAAAPLSSSNGWMYAGPPTQAEQQLSSSSSSSSSYGGRVACGTGPCLSCARRTGAQGLQLLLIDTLREAAASIGRAWALGPIPPGYVVLHASAASALGVSAGSVLIAQCSAMGALVRHALAPAPAVPATRWVQLNASGSGGSTSSMILPLRDASGWQQRAETYGSVIAFPVTVWAIVDSLSGKADASIGGIMVMEYGPFLPFIARMLHLALAAPTVASPTATASQGQQQQQQQQQQGAAAAVVTAVTLDSLQGNLTLTSFSNVSAFVSSRAGGLNAVIDASGAAIIANTLSTAAATTAADDVLAQLGVDFNLGNTTAANFNLDSSPSVLYSFAGQIVANLPPASRVTIYGNTNYDRVRAGVADFASSMLYIAGFSEVDPTLPLLASLEANRFISLYLGLVLNALLIILFFISTVLIYSLLLTDAEGRTFELAVRRMLGSKRTGIIALLLTQAAAYGLPAWVIGLIVGQAIAGYLLSAFGKLATLPIPTTLSPTSIALATAMATLIPAVAAVGPIRGALRGSIRSALDTDRPKAAAVVYTLERSSDGQLGAPFVIVGLGAFTFGFAIYYLVPLALLSLNLTLFFNLFLAVLLGLLGGLVLLALNVELGLLRLLSLVLVASWERPAVSRLLWANVSTGHRPRNRKTVIMYAVSIAFIVFISVAAEAQIESAVYASQQLSGAPLSLIPPALTLTLNSTAGVWASDALISGIPTPADPLFVAAVEAVARAATRGSTTSGCTSTSCSSSASTSAASAALPPALLPWAWAGVSDASDPSIAYSLIPPSPPGPPLPRGALAGTAWRSTTLQNAVRWVTAAGASAWATGYNYSAAVVGDAGSASAATLVAPGGTSTSSSAAAVAAAAALATLPIPPPSLFVSALAITNTGGMDTWTVTLRGVPPTLFSTGATYSQFLVGGSSSTDPSVALPPSETSLGVDALLWTARGSQGVVLGTNTISDVFASRNGPLALTLSHAVSGLTPGAAAAGAAAAAYAAAANGSSSSGSAGVGAYGGGSLLRSATTVVTVSAFLSSAPGFYFSRAPTSLADAALVSFAAMPRIVDEHARAAGVPRVSVGVAIHAPMEGAAVVLLRLVGLLSNSTSTSGGGSAPTPNSTTLSSFAGILSAYSPIVIAHHPLLIRLAAVRALQGALAAADAAATATASGFNFASAFSGSSGGSGSSGSAAALLSGSAVSAPAGFRHLVAGVSFEDIPLDRLYQGFGGSSSDTAPGPVVDAYLASQASARAWAAKLRSGDPTATTDDDGGWFVSDQRAGADVLAGTVALLQALFAALALVAMVLCFFSLSASMATNIMEQVREIGVLRALGLRPRHLIRVFVHEAFLLVLASSLLGTVIGAITAWTFLQQQSLFTSIAVPFVLPWGVLCVIVIASVVCAVLAAALPARRLLARSITRLLKAA